MKKPLNKNSYYTTPYLCIGCEALGNTDWGEVNIDSIAEAINYGISQGICSFDVADTYGLGLAEKNLSNILSCKRHEVSIATKVGVRWKKIPHQQRAKTWIDNSPDYIEQACIASLQRLRLDTLSICYLHWPSPNLTEFLRAVEKLAVLQEHGLLQSLGLSNVNKDQLYEALKIAPIKFVQLPCNVLNASIDPDLIKLCSQNKIKIVAYNVLSSGLLTGKYQKGHQFPNNDRRSRLENFTPPKFEENLAKVAILAKKAKAHNLTLPQYCINCLFHQSKVDFAIIGVKHKHQLKQIIQITDRG